MSRPAASLFCAVALALTASASRLDAAIIRVGPGADFPDIQSAIDAAVDGDVILVEPGTYDPFRLAKGVVIRSAAPDRSFEVQVGAAGSYVLVENTLASQKAGISGMRLLPGATSHGWQGYVWLRDCRGEVVLDAVTVFTDELRAHNRRLLIQSCANVSAANVQAVTQSYSDYWAPPVQATVEISNSQVRMADSVVSAAARFYEGLAGIAVRDSLLILSSTNVFGGDGENCESDPAPGYGGDGIVATRSQVMIIGNATHRIRGGRGGSGLDCNLEGGDGGAGFQGDSGIASLVTIKGGIGGAGNPPGSDGPDWEGSLTRSDVIPYVEVTRDLQPGDRVDVMLRTVEAGLAALVVGSETGFLIDKTKIGPPLSIIPGGLFLVLPIGHVNASTVRVITCQLPEDSQLVGFRLHAQCAVIGSSNIYLTNAVSRILGE